MVQPNKASAAPSQVTQTCLLCRSYADELSPLTDASIRDNATMLLTREAAARSAPSKCISW